MQSEQAQRAPKTLAEFSRTSADPNPIRITPTTSSALHLVVLRILPSFSPANKNARPHDLSTCRLGDAGTIDAAITNKRQPADKLRKYVAIAAHTRCGPVSGGDKGGSEVYDVSFVGRKGGRRRSPFRTTRPPQSLVAAPRTKEAIGYRAVGIVKPSFEESVLLNVRRMERSRCRRRGRSRGSCRLTCGGCRRRMWSCSPYQGRRSLGDWRGVRESRWVGRRR